MCRATVLPWVQIPLSPPVNEIGSAFAGPFFSCLFNKWCRSEPLRHHLLNNTIGFLFVTERSGQIPICRWIACIVSVSFAGCFSSIVVRDIRHGKTDATSSGINGYDYGINNITDADDI